MGLKRTKLLGIQGITGISTVGIYTVGTTQTAGGVGIASTTYLRGAIFHNTGLGSCTTGLYVYPGDVSVVGHGATIYRLMNIDLLKNETFFFEMNYPLVLADQEKIVVDVRQNEHAHGIGTAVNVQILGDTDI